MQHDHIHNQVIEIASSIKCLICHGGSIQDSTSSFAREIKKFIKQQLEHGKTQEEIVQYITSRYGEQILLDPKFDLHTALLWLMPIIVLLLGLVALMYSRIRTSQQHNTKNIF